MTFEDRLTQRETRRQFFGRCGIGVGRLALASLLGDGLLEAAAKAPHFPAKVKNVIYLFMAGAANQPELVDVKAAPESLLKGKRFAFMDSFQKEPPKLLGTKRKFERHGKSGLYVSELLPHIGSVADEIALISGLSTDNFNHGPAKCFINTGST